MDWILWLEEQKGQTPYRERFQTEEIDYNGLLVIGRDHFLTHSLRSRLRWRSKNVIVCGRIITCVTFDHLYKNLNSALMVFEENDQLKQKNH